MKRVIAVTIIIVCMIMMTSCSFSSGTNAGTTVNESKSSAATTTSVTTSVESTTSESTTESTTEETTKAPAEVTVEEQTIFDKGDITVTVKSLSVDEIWGQSLDVLVENNSDKDITVQARNSSINGIMIDTMFSCDVATDKKANDSITFMDTSMEMASIEVVKNIEFSLIILDAESYDTIYETEQIEIDTSADSSYEQVYDDTGFLAVDEKDIKFIIKKLDNEDSFWGADIYVYIENNSKKNVTIQTRDTSVNGFMVDGMFSCDVMAGKKAYSTITFLESDLEDNDIKQIDDLEFYITVFEMKDWDTIFDSDVVKVSFGE